MGGDFTDLRRGVRMAGELIDPPTLEAVVALACRAPSVHNSQPWRMIATDGALRLFLDPHRIPHATDPSGRQSVLSCGALLDHLRVAAGASGWKAHIARFPNPNNLDHLATIEFHRTETNSETDQAHAEAILARRSDRLPFAAPAGWEFIEPVLRGSVDPDQASLFVLPASARPELAQASRMTEALRHHDETYDAELHWWTSSSEVADGIPYGNLVSVSERERVDVGRTFPAEEHPDRRPEVDHDRAVIAVLCTDDDGRREVLGCGEALSGLLLEATSAGLATCPLTHMTEFQASRTIVRELAGGAGDPQVLIRIGQLPPAAEQPSPTPRRPLADVLSVRDFGL